LRHRFRELWRGRNVKGIQFVVDEKGKKTAVLIDPKENANLWEDLYDSATARQRRDEPRETLESVKKRLHQQGKGNS
jgi:hypothetical protein